MYFKLILRELKKNWFMNILIVIQMVIVFVCTICAMSIVSYFYNYYNNFSQYLDCEGEVYKFDSYVSESVAMESSSVIEEQLIKTDIVTTYKPWASYYDENGEELLYTTFAYDVELVDAYEPQIKSGRWINPYRDDGIVEVVVVESDYDITVGDRLLLCDVYNQQPDNMLTVEVVGIVEDGSRIVGSGNKLNGEIVDYTDLYMDYYISEEELPVIMMSIYSLDVAMELKENHSVQRSMSGIMFINYDSDITMEEKAQNERVLGLNVRDYTRTDTNTVKENSIESIKVRVFSILPIFICVFVLVLITGMCNFAISVKTHMKDYAIFGICGMPWMKSAFICVCKSIIICLTALIVSVVGIYIAIKNQFVTETTISLGALPILACVVLSVIYVIISAIMPYALISGTSLNSELKNNI